MTCWEFLQILQDNPEKELRFERVYNSQDNGHMFSVGYEEHQRLGGVTVWVGPTHVTVEINAYNN